MLLQFAALKETCAVKPRVGTKRWVAVKTVLILCRGEIGVKPSVTRARKGKFGVIEMSVFVLGRSKKPLMPCTEKRARILLERKRAVVVRMYPFTIRLKDRKDGELQPLRLSTDPGSKTSGLSVSREVEEVDSQTSEVKRTSFVLFLAELHHRGQKSDSPLDEMTQKEHRGKGNFGKNHSNTGQEKSEVDHGNAWKKQKYEY